VDDAGRSLQDTAEDRPVPDAAAYEADPCGEPVSPPGRQVVEHQELHARGVQRPHHVATDVTGSTCHHPRARNCHDASCRTGKDHVRSSRGVGEPRARRR
jgi:hypothetical protein